MKPTVITTEYTPMAAESRRANHLPTMVRLTTERALCPRPRVSVSSSSSETTPATALMAITTTPSDAASAVSTSRLPTRSTRRPMPKQKSAPTSVAARLICA